MTDTLVIQTGKHKGRKIKFPAEGKLVIGRDAECHLRLASTDVSRKHCELLLDREQITVRDLGSRNGTFIDGFLISETASLKPGSVLRVGNMEFALPGQKPRTKTSPPTKAVDDTSDDDIAAWLTEEGETEEPNLDDSTIIPGQIESPPEPEQEAVDLKNYARHPHAEQAAKIIRDHWRNKLES